MSQGRARRRGNKLDKRFLSKKARHAQAFETRARLATFEEDWNAPGMEVYDADNSPTPLRTRGP